MKGFPVRYMILALSALAAFVEYLTRLNINVTIVSMVKEGNSSVPFNATQANDDVSGGETQKFDWSPSTQGIVLGTFFYGYVLLQIPSARMAEIFGGKWVVGASLLISGAVNLLTPVLVQPLGLFLASRVILGLAQGAVFPACYSILFNWLPTHERSLGYSLLSVGGNVGAVFTSAMSGYLSEHGFSGGWPSVFYVSGVIGVVTFVLWTVAVKSDPSGHSLVSDRELRFIRNNSNSSDLSSLETTLRKKPPVPWYKILTSKAVLAVMLVRFCGNWGCTSLHTKLPAYFHDVLGISVTKDGFLNALLYGSICSTLLFGGYLSEVVISRGYLKRTGCRKMFNSIALLGCSFCLILVSFCSGHETLSLVLLMSGMAAYGLTSGGEIPIAAEMTTHFPATIYSLANGVANIPGIVAPYVYGLILESAETPDDLEYQWHLVFYFAATVNALGALVFVCFASATIQPWDHLACNDHEKQNSAVVSE